MAHGIDNGAATPKLSGKFASIIGTAPKQEPEDIQEMSPATDETEAVIAPAEEKAPAARPVKKAKTNGKHLRSADKGDRTERLSFEVSKAEKKQINIGKIELDMSVSHMGRIATLGLVTSSYICAACSKKFIILNEDGEKDKPAVCPVCQCAKLSRLVR